MLDWNQGLEIIKFKRFRTLFGASFLLPGLVLTATFLTGACQMEERPLSEIKPAQRLDYFKKSPPMTIDEDKEYIATIRTYKGDIVIKLEPFYAPQHVNNFVFLARQGFYDGIRFHRLEPGFVVQGGCPLSTGLGGPGYVIPQEIGLPHVKGAVAAARQPDDVNPEKNSSGSQFYITYQPTPFLDGEYTVFGKVIEGWDVVMHLVLGDMIERIDIEEKDSEQ